MINIYTYNIDNLTEKSLLSIEHLSESRIEKITSFKSNTDRLLSLAAGLLLEKIFGPKCEDEILYNKYQKPFSKNNTFFNLSHSGRYVALAVSSSNVGIDIEENLELPFESILKTAFHPDEIALFHRSTNKEQLFYKLWTAKESYIKYLGTGFSLDPSSFSVLNSQQKLFLNSTIERVKPIISRDYSSAHIDPCFVNFIYIPFAPNYSLSICTSNEDTFCIEELKL